MTKVLHNYLFVSIDKIRNGTVSVEQLDRNEISYIVKDVIDENDDITSETDLRNKLENLGFVVKDITPVDETHGFMWRINTRRFKKGNLLNVVVHTNEQIKLIPDKYFTKWICSMTYKYRGFVTQKLIDQPHKF